MTSASSISLEIPALTNSVVENIIFLNLSLPALASCSRVCKTWNKMAKQHLKAFCYDNAFGPKEWYIYFNAQLRNVPRLPTNIANILSSTCPFWTDKKVHETHVLILIPETVNGQPLTLDTLGELVQNPRKSFHKAKYDNLEFGEYIDLPTQSHWALLTRTVIEGSRNKPYQDEEALLTLYSQKAQVPYEIPTVLDTVVCNFMEYVRSKTWLYGENPCTYTFCEVKHDAVLQVVVGGGSSSGLNVDYFSFGANEYFGVGGLRKF